jgi:hypothetical protein
MLVAKETNMECTLATLVACFSWSGLYVDTGIQVNDVGPYSRTYVDSPNIDAPMEYRDFRLPARNPYGSFGIGYDVTVGRFTWSLSAQHVSSLDTGEDHGVNSIRLGVRWRPFR